MQEEWAEMNRHNEEAYRRRKEQEKFNELKNTAEQIANDLDEIKKKFDI